jgi:hypothetical protein
LAIIWLLSRAAGDYGRTEIRFHIQRIYEESCRREGIFESGDVSIIRRACEDLSTYMLRDVPSALFGESTEDDDPESPHGIKGYIIAKNNT